MTAFMLSQIIAFISFCSDLIAFYLPKRVYVLRTLAFSTLLLSGHFYLLENYSAAAMMLLACFRFLVATYSTHHSLVYFFLIAALASCAITWQGITDLFSLGGSLLLTCAAFQTNDYRLRLYTLGGCLFWIANNIATGSPVAILMETTFFVSTLISLIRIRRQAVGSLAYQEWNKSSKP